MDINDTTRLIEVVMLGAENRLGRLLEASVRL